MQAVIWNM